MFGMETKSFFAPGGPEAPAGAGGAPVLELAGVSKTFARGGFLSPTTRVVAAEDVSFRLARGEAVALVGESGSGKSTIARLVLRLEEADAGALRLDGVDVLAREPRGATLDYRRRVQMVFQDPFGSLNPMHTVEHHLARPLLRHRRASRDDVRARAVALLHTVGLEPAEEFVTRYPYELSGGQRQRVAIARALAVEPDVLVADEPTSMLDVSIRAGILGLLRQLKRERGLALLLITHDLASARALADRILVLFRGRVVEDGPAADVVAAPVHPYTRALLGAIAGVERAAGASPAAVAAASEGCPFAPRCAETTDLCRRVDPPAVAVGARRVRCHLVMPDRGN